jgi:hypothetical protein
MVLGSLIKGLSNAGIHPLPDAPYNGHSFAQLRISLETMPVPTLCETMRWNGYRGGSRVVTCGVAEALDVKACQAEGILFGLQLDKALSISGGRFGPLQLDGGAQA